MPGKVKVKIVAGRNLPVMDRSNDTTDAYVEVKCGNTTHKTDVCRKTLNPQFNSEWFRFEMDDLELQDEPLQIRLMDHDTYSANDAIGKVYLDLNPLLTSTPKRKDDTTGKLITGWIPVYDTMHGIRGEVNLIVKIELFSDVNKFRQSSCGVKFFFTPAIPEGYFAHTVQGFVEELVVNDDPEYQWIDKIRTPRASNEARQTLFSKLSGEVQRRVGLKALELGGNAVIGYRQCFDLEGESGIVVRGIGTAVTLTKIIEEKLSPTCAGDSCGLSRECQAVDDQLLPHYPFARNGLVFRSCKKKGRAPRLHKRSVRAPTAALSMSDTVLLNHHLHHHSSTNDMNDVSHDEDESTVSSGSALKERSSSFRNDPLLMKLRLKKRSTACSSSMPASWVAASPPAIASSSPAKNTAHSVAADAVAVAVAALPVPAPSSATSISQPSASQKPENRKTPYSFLLKPSSISFPWLSHSTGRLGRSTSSANTNTNTMTHPPKAKSTNRSHIKSPDCLHTDHNPRHTHRPLTRDEPPPDPPVTSTDDDDAFCMLHSSLASSSVPRRFAKSCPHQHSHSTSDVTLTPLRIFIPPPRAPELGDSGSISNVDAEGEADLDDSTSDNSQRFGFELGGTGADSGTSLSLHEVKVGIGDTEVDESDRGRDTRSADEDEELDVYSVNSVPLPNDTFLAMRKKRGSRKKDRFSKTSLIKRASENFADKGLLFGGTDRIREEVVKFFKRKKSSDDNESGDSASQSRKALKTKPSPYREAKFIFRRRRPAKTSVCAKLKASQLVRSTSESHSLGQTSIDSLPSVGSEPPVFDPDEVELCLSQQDLLEMMKTKDVDKERPRLSEDDVLQRSQSLGRNTQDRGRSFPSSSPPSLTIEEALIRMSAKRHPLRSCHPRVDLAPRNSKGMRSASSCEPPPSSHSHTTSDSSNTPGKSTAAPSAPDISDNSAGVLQVIRELGYRTDKPLKLYISSMDALLVYEPLESTNCNVLESSDAAGNALNENVAFSDPRQELDESNLERVSSSMCARFTKNGAPVNVVSSHSTNTRQITGDAQESTSILTKDSKIDSVCSMMSKGSIYTTTNTNTTASLNYDSSSSSSFGFGGYKHSFGPNNIYSSGLALNRQLDDDNDFDEPDNKVFSDSSQQCRSSTFYGLGRSAGRGSHSSVSDEEGLWGGQRPRVQVLSVNNESSTTRHEVPSSVIANRETSSSNVDVTAINLSYSGGVREIRKERVGVSCTNSNNRSKYNSANHLKNNSTNHCKSNSSKHWKNNSNNHSINIEGAAINPDVVFTKALLGRCTGYGNATEAVYANASSIDNYGVANVRKDAIVHDFEHSAKYRSPIAEEHNEKSCSPLSNRSQTASLSTPTSTAHTNTFVSSSSTSLNASTTNCTAAATTASSPTTTTLTNTDTNANSDTPLTTTDTFPSTNLQITNKSKNANSTPINTYNNDRAEYLSDVSAASGSKSKYNETNFPYPPPLPSDFNKFPCKFSSTSIDPSVHTTMASYSIGNSLQGANNNTSSTMSPSAFNSTNNNNSKKETLSGSPSIPAPTPVSHQIPVGPSAVSVNALNVGFSSVSVNTSLANSIPRAVIHRRSSESDLCLTSKGGFVSAKSVKLLERMPNMDEPQSRDAWWTEARLEIRSHARSLGCNCVIGYEEKTTMCEDVCILSITGTAAIVSSSTLDPNDVGFATMLKSKFRDTEQDSFSKNSEIPGERTHLVSNESPSAATQPNFNVRLTLKQKLKKLMGYLIPPTSLHCGDGGDTQGLKMRSQKTRHVSDGPFDPRCAVLHRPLYALTVPNAPKLGRCAICKSARVPEALLTTIEIPVGLHITGKSCLIQAQVFRPKSYNKGELCAKEVSDSLPFLEYEIYRRLINKLKVKGMNAVFGLQSQLCLGDKMMVAIASGTAVFVTGLPAPSVPLINTTAETDSQKVTQFQKVLQEAYDRNRELYEVQDVVLPTLTWINPPKQAGVCGSDGDESDGDESIPEIYLPDWISNDKNTYVLEVDDAEDIDIISVLIDPSPPLGYHMNCTEHLVGFNDCRVVSQQMFTKVWRYRMPAMTLRHYTTHFDKLLRSICFKLRSIKPCNLTNLRFRIEIPEQDEIQIAIIGLAVGLAERIKASCTLENSSAHKNSSSCIKGVGSETAEMNFVIDDELNNQGHCNDTPTVLDSNNGIPTSFSSTSMSGNGGGPGTVMASTSNVTTIKTTCSPGSASSFSNLASVVAPGIGRSRFSVEITPLSYIHGAKIEKYLGNLNFFFIRETTSIRESGGLSGFMQNFVSEVLGIIRAHVSALGGNAMVSYFLQELALLHNPHKNQGQCLINVGGDVVLAAYTNSVQEDTIISS